MAIKTKEIDYVIDLDEYSLNEEEKTLFEETAKKDKQAKRWFLTLNNPFWTEKDVEIDLSNNDLPINYEYYNLDYCKSFNNIDLFDFHYIKVKAKVKEKVIDKALKEDAENKYIEIELQKEIIVEKEFIVERPYFKSYDHFKQYMENLQIEGLKWSTGQVEKGHKEETLHIQFGICFDETHGKRFYTMKKYFPTAYIAQARGSNFDIMKYCTKVDTRVEEPFQIGKIAEMRSRTDIDEFYQAIKSGADNFELLENFYALTTQFGFDKIDKQRDVYFNSKYRDEWRNIETTYYYGDSGVGKTTLIYKQYGFKNVFRVSYYGKFMFNGYNGEKVLLLDEFTGQISLTWLNQILDGYPLKVEVKGGERIACFEKIYIISNFSLYTIYKQQREHAPKEFETLFRRIHHIYLVEKGKLIPKKESIFEDIPENEVDLKGRTKRVSQSYNYNEYGQKFIIYDYHHKHLEGLQEIEQTEMIFEEEGEKKND